MDSYTVSFFGHRTLSNALQIEAPLQKIITDLICSKFYVEFLVGRDGEFDLMVSSTVHRCKRTIREDNSILVWVMPYMTAEYKANEDSFRQYYDEVEVCEFSSGAHYRSAHQIRNKAMVDRSDLIICCIDHPSGGAYQTIRYAKKQGKQIINLSEVICHE